VGKSTVPISMAPFWLRGSFPVTLASLANTQLDAKPAPQGLEDCEVAVAQSCGVRRVTIGPYGVLSWLNVTATRMPI